MKRTYYLRGIGVGILFATIILFTAYCVSGAGKMSDEDVIKRAEELGMVQEESLLDHLNKSTDAPASSESEQDTASDTADASSGESTGEASVTTEARQTSEAETEAASEEGRVVTFTVVSGMSSWNVATILQDQGVISDASDFDSYLEANGYSSRISTGEYSVTVGADYETIARLLTGG